METIIVIPCYNEAARLPAQTFIDYVQNNSGIGIVFVNDGSADATLELLLGMRERSAAIHVLNLPANGGKAQAVRQGMMYAVQNFQPRYIGFWDADLAAPLCELERLLGAIKKGFEIVTGMRIVRLGADIKRKKWRHYAGRIFATCAAAILRIPVYDTQCGAKLFRADIVETLFGQPFVTRWLFDVEILARYVVYRGAAQTIKNVCELPLLQWQDVGGSQVKMTDFVKAPMELLKIKRTYF